MQAGRETAHSWAKPRLEAGAPAAWERGPHSRTSTSAAPCSLLHRKTGPLSSVPFSTQLFFEEAGVINNIESTDCKVKLVLKPRRAQQMSPTSHPVSTSSLQPQRRVPCGLLSSPTVTTHGQPSLPLSWVTGKVSLL